MGSNLDLGSMTIVVRVVLFGALLSIPGCFADRCVAGRIESCACGGGATGTQICLRDGTFGACSCGGFDAGTDTGTMRVDAGSDTGSDAGTTSDASDGGALDVPTPDDAPADAGADPTGHVVLIGRDPGLPADGVDAMIANAVLLTERTGTIDVLEYTQYADVGFRMHVLDVVRAGATARGRTVAFSELTNAFDLAARLPDTDVLLVRAQVFIGPDAMQTIATGWHDPLVAFLDAGGVVVVLAGATGASGGANGREAFVVSGDRLFSVASFAGSAGSSSILEIVTPADPIATGVVSPVAASSIMCFPGSAGGVLVARTTGDLCPVVRHLVF